MISEFKNREKKQALLFITLGLVMTVFSYQNFQYPEHLKKTSIDVDATLNASEVELQKTINRLGADADIRPQGLPIKLASTKTQVVDSDVPMKLKLKRAPAKSTLGKKKSKKNKAIKKFKKTSKKSKKSSRH